MQPGLLPLGQPAEPAPLLLPVPEIRSEQRGAVYTPPDVAAAMCRWAIRSAAATVLDPAAGDGVFLRAGNQRLASLGAPEPECFGVDIDAATARESGALHADFFRWNAATNRTFDAVLGNPPYVRSHQFPEESRQIAFAGMRGLGMRPSRLMSTWAPFVALASTRVAPGGRMALVVPEELLTIGYATELRKQLQRRFRSLTICTPPRNLFRSVQQATVLLLADDSEAAEPGLHVLDYGDLCAGRYEAARPAPPWSWSGKWTHILLGEPARWQVEQLLGRLRWRTLSAFARVEVGIVTGNNRFFLLDRSRAGRIRRRHRVPVLSRTNQVPGTVFVEEEYRRLRESGAPVELLNLQCTARELDGGEAATVRAGEADGVSGGYKCRNRAPWYAVPSVRKSDAVLFRQSGRFPRIVHLEHRSAVTDTMHRIVWRDSVCGPSVATGFLNAWTLLYAELFGRSYGGGVLELMPSEARNLPIPDPDPAVRRLAPVVDRMVRRRQFEDAIGLVSRTVLAECTPAERDETCAILLRLGDRRNRRAPPPSA